MRTNAKRRRMIRKHKHAIRLTGSVHLLLHNPQYALVKILDCLKFSLQASLMPHLIGCFQMNIRKVSASPKQGIYGCLRFPLIIRMKAAVCALYLDHLHTGANCNALQKIDG